MNAVKTAIRKLTGQDMAENAARRRRVFGVSLEDRRAAIVRGIRRYGERFAREGDTAMGKHLTDAADAAEKALAENADATAAAEAMRAHAVKDAARDTAKHLMKSMPGAFADVDDAARWAEAHLPFSAAHREDDLTDGKRADLARKAAGAMRSFGEITERAAVKIFGSVDSSGLEKVRQFGMGAAA